VPDPVSYAAVLPIGESAAAFVAGLLDAERRQRRTRRGRRALDCVGQAAMVLRWFLDGTRVARLACDNQVSSSTAYRYLHEAIDVLAAVAPGVHGALSAARTAGHTHVNLDGTLIRTDRSKAVGPTAGGGSVVVGQAPRSRREHPGTHRAGWMATVDLAGASGPRARHHLRPHP
jgi:hypothetical protein